MEQKVKLLLGELMFQIASLQFNIELLQKENEELKNKLHNSVNNGVSHETPL